MKKHPFFEGFRDSIPIGLGYFAVAFSLGILAKKAGLNATQGFIASLLNVASAGENALFNAILDHETYIEVAVITFVVNARYFLMSCSLSQKFSQNTKFIHRLFVGFGVTDEIFGITIARKGPVEPAYNYGAFAFSIPCWALGTSIGVIAGSILPDQIVQALSAALYGMFIAIFIPPAKKDWVIAVAVITSFITSYLSDIIPYIRDLSPGTRTIILTVLISSIVAIIKPIKTEDTPTEKLEETPKDNI